MYMYICYSQVLYFLFKPTFHIYNVIFQDIQFNFQCPVSFLQLHGSFVVEIFYQQKICILQHLNFCIFILKFSIFSSYLEKINQEPAGFLVAIPSSVSSAQFCEFNFMIVRRERKKKWCCLFSFIYVGYLISPTISFIFFTISSPRYAISFLILSQKHSISKVGTMVPHIFNLLVHN